MDGIARYQGHREPAPIPRKLDAMPICLLPGHAGIGRSNDCGAPNMEAPHVLCA
jgi:hypothetical protein